MTPARSPWIAAGLAALCSLAFVLLVRMPVPFPGFTLLAGAILAALGTLTLAAWMPSRWLWTDQERLTHAFCAHHGISELGAENALAAITQAHARAETLRTNAAGFQDDVRARVEQAAERLDAGAREIFYDPARLRALQPILVRSELIEDAVRSHRALRGRAKGREDAIETSRGELLRGLDAIEAAFEESDLMAARGLIRDVESASSVAEMLLTPKRTVNL